MPTGSITPGGTGRVVVRWQRPFATAQYAVIGSVADAEDDVRSVELSHIVMPNSPEVAVAVVVNRDTTAPHSGRVCLDATTESGDVVGALR